MSEKKPIAGGWNPKVVAIWDWKTRIPQTYPSDVFYGKVQGGDAALKRLQVSLNIVRSNDPKLKNDFWIPMRELHLDIVEDKL